MKKLVFAIFLAVSLCSVVYAACDINIDAGSTDELLKEIPEIDSKLQECDIELPEGIRSLYGDAVFQVTIGKNKRFAIYTKDGKLTKVSTDIVLPKYIIDIKEEKDLDAILQNEDKLGTVAYLYNSGRITIKANTFMSRIKLFFLRPIIKFSFNKIQKPLNLDAENIDVG